MLGGAVNRWCWLMPPTTPNCSASSKPNDWAPHSSALLAARRMLVCTIGARINLRYRAGEHVAVSYGGRVGFHSLGKDPQPVGNKPEDGGKSQPDDIAEQHHATGRGHTQEVFGDKHKTGLDAGANTVQDQKKYQFAQHVGLAAVAEGPVAVGDQGESGGRNRGNDFGLDRGILHRPGDEPQENTGIDKEADPADHTEFGQLTPQ